MERNFYTDDFERLIRQKADQYKMYPSDQVWKGVYKSIHGRKRWRWAGLAVFLLGIGIYTGNWYFSDKPAKQIANNIQPSISANQDFRKVPAPNAANGAIAMNRSPIQNNTVTNNINPTNNSTFNNQLSVITEDNKLQPASQPIVSGIIHSNETPLVISNTGDGGVRNLTDAINNTNKQNTTQKEASNDLTKETVKNTLTENTNTSFADASSESVSRENKLQSVNWLEDYAVFQLTPAKPKRIGLQLYFSPTVNYRKLSGSSNFPSSEVKSIPLSPNIMGDVEQYVKHKPALGFEMGANLLYRSTKRINFKAGFQFNYSRYNIEAYASQPEIATIALNNSQAFIADTISTLSRIRNLSGYAQEDLSNQYFQLSMPVGIEFRLFGTDKLQLNVAGTIQPTYLLNRNTYLITTDYKNYMREPSLVRRWNVNGGMEAYVSYYTGTVRWQVGPQFRYQLLSTYSSKYPLKEQLMEYGIKVGVSKTIR